MPKIIIDDNGEEMEVFTAEELAAERQTLTEKHAQELADKEAHVQEKLAQLKNKEGGIDNAESEAVKKAEEAKLLVEQLQSKITETEKSKQETIKNFWINQTAGGDEELIKKLTEAYELINLPINSENDISQRVSLATQLVGIKTIEIPMTPFMNGVAPTFTPVKDSANQASYEDFKSTLGLS